MIGSLLTIEMALAAVAVVGAGGLGLAATRVGGDELDAIDEGKGTGFEMRPVPTSKGIPGLRWLSKRNRERKRKKALKEGYIKWHVVSDSVSKPKYIKPEQKEGGDVPEFDYEGETYVFPRNQMLPDEEDGVYWCMHEQGKAEPIPLREGNPDSMSAHALKEYLTMRVTSKKPGGLSGIVGDLSAADIMKYGLLAIVGYAVLMEVMGGGLF